MTFGELFHLAGTNTVFTVILGEKTSECIELLSSDLGAGTKEAEVLYSLMPKKVIMYMPGRMASKRLGLKHTWPHLTVVLETTESAASTTGKHISAMRFHGPMAKTARRQNGEESLPS